MLGDGGGPSCQVGTIIDSWPHDNSAQLQCCKGWGGLSSEAYGNLK